MILTCGKEVESVHDRFTGQSERMEVCGSPPLLDGETLARSNMLVGLALSIVRKRKYLFHPK